MSNKNMEGPLVGVIKQWYQDEEICYFARVEFIRGKLKLSKLYQRPLTKFQEIRFTLDSNIYLCPDGQQVEAIPLRQFLSTKDFFNNESTINDKI